MALVDVTIVPKTEGKGRAFSATYLSGVMANSLWEGGGTSTDLLRPIFATFLGSEDALRPFVANLLLGRPALFPDKSRGGSRKGLEFLRSAGYKLLWQREPEGAIVTLFLPPLFLLDPGMVDPKAVKFVILPSDRWISTQTGIPVEEMVRYARALPTVTALNAPPKRESWMRPDDYKQRREAKINTLSDAKLAKLAPIAYLFAAYLDRRTRAPLPADGRFYLQFLIACLDKGYASWSMAPAYRQERAFGHNPTFRFAEEGCDNAGLLPGIAFHATHEGVEALLAEEITTYFAMIEDPVRGALAVQAREIARLQEQVKRRETDDADDNDNDTDEEEE